MIFLTAIRSIILKYMDSSTVHSSTRSLTDPPKSRFLSEHNGCMRTRVAAGERACACACACVCACA